VTNHKTALIPIRADKYAAFAANFGATHFPAFAAGDHPDDLNLLRNAAFPLTTGNAEASVRDCVTEKGGFVAPRPGHAGTAALVEHIQSRLE